MQTFLLATSPQLARSKENGFFRRLGEFVHGYWELIIKGSHDGFYWSYGTLFVNTKCESIYIDRNKPTDKYMFLYFSLIQIDCNSDNSEKSEKRQLLESWLNKIMRIKISDGRTLIGSFLCTDRDRNIILGSCQEFVGSAGK